jgi:hypothetical protein
MYQYQDFLAEIFFGASPDGPGQALVRNTVLNQHCARE